MKTTNNNFRKKRITNLILLIFLSMFLSMQAKAQENIVDQINLPGDLDEASGIAGDIITADGKVFVYTTQNVLVYNSNGIFINSISIDDGAHYSKFAPLYFWSEKYLADNQMMTHNSNQQMLYVLAPNLDIKVINTQTLEVETTWLWPGVEGIQSPMHGLAILKYDNIRQRLFLVINSRSETQGNPYSFHSRAVYLAIYSVGDNGTTKTLMHSEVNDLGSGGDDYNSTIFDIEFNDITDINSNLYDHFYLARRFRIQTCKLNESGQNFEMHVVSEFPDLNLEPDEVPPYEPDAHPGKFTKLLYIHDDNIHKIVAVPYRMPVPAYEPPLIENVIFSIVDLDDSDKNQMIISPHKRIIDVAFLEGHKDLVMCFGDKEEFFNPEYNDETENDIAVFQYNNTSGKFNTTPSFINSNGNAREITDDFVKLNIPLRIVKNASNPTNSFFLSKANEIVRLDHGGTEYIVDNTPYQGEGSHFFMGAAIGNNTYILNTAKSGFEKFEGSSHNSTVQTGFQALKLCPDPGNNKLYIYNDLNIHNSEVFHFPLDGDFSEDNATKLAHNGLLDNSAIGSIIKNPKQNHILIARNSDGGGVFVLDAQSSSVLTNQPTNLLNIGSYVRELFISPKGYLYVMLNSRNTDPVIKVFDANNDTYPEITDDGYTLEDFEQNDFTTYNADFCYNPYNDTVYAIVTTNNTTHNPYFTAKNTASVNGINREFFRSALINADRQNNNNILLENIQMAGQIICPQPDELPPDYQGELIINASKTDDTFSQIEGLILYNCASGEVLVNAQHSFNQITYSHENQTIYGFEGKQTSDETPHLSNFYHTAYSPNTGFANPAWFGSYEGQVLNITANPYDNKVYVQTKVDKTRLGIDGPMKLLDYNMANHDETGETPLSDRGFYTELDFNYETYYYYYPITTPYIDPYTNKIYLPNGGHSNVSVVEFEANEPLYLDPTVWNWVSFPRTKVPYPTNSVTVMTDNIQPFQVFRSDLYNLPFGEETGSEISMTYNEQTGWVTDPGGLEKIYNVSGYKLSIDKNHLAERQLFLEGGLIDIDASIESLYQEKENWVGYWLHEPQDAFDALSDILPELYVIKAEKWTCIRDNQIFGPNADWICDDRNTFIEYGEMLVLKPYSDIDNFQWNHSGNQPIRQDGASPEYYSYTETDDYSPMVIELDTTDNPQEIGAFVGDSCIGASAVESDDTTVAMRAYLNGANGDSVTFEKYYGTKSSSNRINSYYVFNKERGVHEKRAINPKEKSGYFRVSFKTPNESELNRQGYFQLRIFPNPTKGMVKLEYFLDKDAFITIKVFDINGKMMQSLEIKKSRGKHITTFDLATTYGNKPNPGIYLLQLSTGSETETRKIVVE